jgi:serine/threonine protein kinase
MEHLDGQPITDFCAARRMGTTARVTLFRSVCDAVQYAHQNLSSTATSSRGTCSWTSTVSRSCLDFGIAKLLASGVDPDLAPTATVLPLMTPEYASPEQGQGPGGHDGERRLLPGVLLYELLAGRRPYEIHTDSLEAIVQASAGRNLERPAEAVERTGATQPARSLPLASELRGDLDTIVLKALRKEPERTLSDRPRAVRGPPAPPRRASGRGQGGHDRYRAGKFVRRHRLPVAAGVLLVFSLAAA